MCDADVYQSARVRCSCVVFLGLSILQYHNERELWLILLNSVLICPHIKTTFTNATDKPVRLTQTQACA